MMNTKYRSQVLLSLLLITPDTLFAAGKLYAIKAEYENYRVSIFEVLFPFIVIAGMFLLAAWSSSGEEKNNKDKKIEGKTDKKRFEHPVYAHCYSTTICVIPPKIKEEDKKQDLQRQKQNEEEKARRIKESELRNQAAEIADEIRCPMKNKIKKIILPLLGVSLGCFGVGLLLGLLFGVKSLLFVIGFEGILCSVIEWFILGFYFNKQFNKKIKKYINSHPNEEYIKYLLEIKF